MSGIWEKFDWPEDRPGRVRREDFVFGRRRLGVDAVPTDRPPHEFDSSRTCNYCGVAAEKVPGTAEHAPCPARPAGQPARFGEHALWCSYAQAVCNCGLTAARVGWPAALGEIAGLRARVAELEAALRPLAALGKAYFEKWPLRAIADDAVRCEELPAGVVTLGDLRRPDALLAADAPPPEPAPAVSDVDVACCLRTARPHPAAAYSDDEIDFARRAIAWARAHAAAPGGPPP